MYEIASLPRLVHFLNRALIIDRPPREVYLDVSPKFDGP